MMRMEKILCAVFLLSMLCVRTPLHGQDLMQVPGFTKVLPTKSQSMVGFTVMVEVPSQAIGVGYIPVKIVANSTSVFTADRELMVRLEPLPDGQSPPQNGVSVDIPFTAPQGKRSVTLVRHMPKWSVESGYKIQVLEDGKKLTDYEAVIGSGLPLDEVPLYCLEDETLIGWLLIEDQDVNNFRFQNAHTKMAVTIQSSYANYRWRQQLTGRTGHQTVTKISVNKTPTDWRQFQAFDGVLISSSSLESLKSNPDSFNALRDWVLGGGTLAVTQSDSIDELSKQLKFVLKESTEAQRRLNGVAWSMQVALRQEEEAVKKSIARYETDRSNAQNGSSIQFLSNRIKALEKRLAEVRSRYATLDDKIVATTVGAGRVLGITDSYEDLGDLQSAGLANLFLIRRSAILRRGVEPILGDSRANQWMIPGVAEPPVYTFMGLLTLFVILVGPIAYRKTSKAGRSHLMFVIAPVLALATTLAMFVYGIVADGFGTKARVRQITIVDGQSGDSFDRIRSTYFAGLRPSGGIEFSANAEVFPYPNNPTVAWEDLSELPFLSDTKVTMAEDSQTFGSALLPSRSQTQFVVHQPRNQFGRLKLSRSEDQKVYVLDSTIDYALRNVVLRDADGDYWLADEVQPKQTGIVCKPLDPKKVSKLLGQIYNSYRPVARVREARANRQRDEKVRDLINNLNRAVAMGSGAVINDGIFEQTLRSRLQLSGDLPTASFVAMADVSEDVLLVEGTRLVSSIRYVMGTLP